MPLLLPSPLMMTTRTMLPPGEQRQTQPIEILSTHGEANPRQNKLDTTPQTTMPIGQDNVPIATATSAPSECMAHSFAKSVASS